VPISGDGVLEVLSDGFGFLRSSRQVYALSDILKQFIRNDNIREKIEPVMFVLLGTVLSIWIIQPTTPAQAFAAGVGWTSLASK
jgi:hypothetical protein